MLSDKLIGLLSNPECPDFVLRDAVIEEECKVANVYVVYGESGEYSDFLSWNVAAFLDEDQAIARVEACNNWLIANDQHVNNENIDYSSAPPLELDPHYAGRGAYGCIYNYHIIELCAE